MEIFLARFIKENPQRYKHPNYMTFKDFVPDLEDSVILGFRMILLSLD